MRSRLRVIGAACLTVLLLWAWLAWPLPRFFTAGIPSSARNLERFNYLTMIPGDHLQLLYHFRLAKDVLTGNTPPLTNPYEFNTGDDSRRTIHDPHFIPFSIVYSALSTIGGLAFAWNMTALLSLFMTFGFTYALARRYITAVPFRFLAATISIIFPYRWVALMCGSPTGFAMAFIPMLLLGLDVAVRDRRAAGAWLAGLALMLANFTDMHVFYFSALASPFWVLVALAADRSFPWNSPRAYARLILPLLPYAACAIGALLLSRLLRGSYAETDIAGGRTIREVALCSPRPMGLWTWHVQGLENQIFVGVVLTLLLAAALAGTVVAVWKRRRDVQPAGRVVALLAVAIIVVVLLAVGVYGPLGGLPIQMARKIIPEYSMIRQPMKIFCLLPVFLGLLVASGFDLCMPLLKRRWILPTVAGTLLLLTLGELKVVVNPTISLLRSTQGAYQAVADNAREHGRAPRAVILPLWPGDTHYSSIYEHYVMMYRIRMVNGYSPIRDKHYIRDVYSKLERMNHGEFSEATWTRLAELGIEYIILHEDLFPERIARRPSTQILQRLFSEERLSFLATDHGAWAFRILSPGEPATPLTRRMRSLVASWSFDWASYAPLAVGQDVRIPAATLFHTGFSDLEDGCVVLLRDAEPDRCVLYGRLIPLVQGTYEVRAFFDSPAPPGTRVGYVSLEQDGSEVTGIQMFQGETPRAELTVHENYTPFLKLFFTRNGDVRINAFQIRRLR